jgi:hypothetical protein
MLEFSGDMACPFDLRGHLDIPAVRGNVARIPHDDTDRLRHYSMEKPGMQDGSVRLPLVTAKRVTKGCKICGRNVTCWECMAMSWGRAQWRKVVTKEKGEFYAKI